MTFDPVTTFAIYVFAILLLMAVLAAAGDYLAARSERRDRDQARAEARAELRRERELSDAMEPFSWQD